MKLEEVLLQIVQKQQNQIEFLQQQIERLQNVIQAMSDRMNGDDGDFEPDPVFTSLSDTL